MSAHTHLSRVGFPVATYCRPRATAPAPRSWSRTTDPAKVTCKRCARARLVELRDEEGFAQARHAEYMRAVYRQHRREQTRTSAQRADGLGEDG